MTGRRTSSSARREPAVWATRLLRISGGYLKSIWKKPWS
jgi:hypothetical protein